MAPGAIAVLPIPAGLETPPTHLAIAYPGGRTRVRVVGATTDSIFFQVPLTTLPAGTPFEVFSVPGPGQSPAELALLIERIAQTSEPVYASDLTDELVVGGPSDAAALVASDAVPAVSPDGVAAPGGSDSSTAGTPGGATGGVAGGVPGEGQPPAPGGSGSTGQSGTSAGPRTASGVASGTTASGGTDDDDDASSRPVSVQEGPADKRREAREFGGVVSGGGPSSGSGQDTDPGQDDDDDDAGSGGGSGQDDDDDDAGTGGGSGQDDDDDDAGSGGGSGQDDDDDDAGSGGGSGQDDDDDDAGTGGGSGQDDDDDDAGSGGGSGQDDDDDDAGSGGGSGQDDDDDEAGSGGGSGQDDDDDDAGSGGGSGQDDDDDDAGSGGGSGQDDDDDDAGSGGGSSGGSTGGSGGGSPGGGIGNPGNDKDVGKAGESPGNSGNSGNNGNNGNNGNASSGGGSRDNPADGGSDGGSSGGRDDDNGDDDDDGGPELSRLDAVDRPFVRQLVAPLPARAVLSLFAGLGRSDLHLAQAEVSPALPIQSLGGGRLCDPAQGEGAAATGPGAVVELIGAGPDGVPLVSPEELAESLGLGPAGLPADLRATPLVVPAPSDAPEFAFLAPIDATPGAADIVASLGGTALRGASLPNLGLQIVVVDLSGGVPAAEVRAILQADGIDAAFDANHLFEAGQGKRTYANSLVGAVPVDSCRLPAPVRIGLIDGPVARSNPYLAGLSLTEFSAVGRDVATGSADHATGIASLMAAPPSGDGFAGIAPGAELLSAVAFGRYDERDAASMESIARSIDWLLGQDVSVINMSLAGPRNEVLRRIMETAAARGAILVAASGNDAAAEVAYPGSDPAVIAVTALDAAKRPYGNASVGDEVEFAAPGVDVLVAEGDGTAYRTGTSYAAAVLSALVAHEIAAGRVTDSAQIRELLQTASEDLGDSGRDALFGWGLPRLPDCAGDN
ncbi:S8 family serine peptidase [Palleronia sp. KMU-117]|uniref:S8 family serine peptidase n=1 Tax=Palleronia sp. KMU-117 TaxID=3434108 RepID=UPI003D74560E